MSWAAAAHFVLPWRIIGRQYDVADGWNRNLHMMMATDVIKDVLFSVSSTRF